MNSPIISVVMPLYNGRRFLHEAIESVLAQTFYQFELLIIDDGSTDGSQEILKSFVDPRIILLENDQNRGVAFTRNVGIKEARGEFLAWLDCDDIMSPSRLATQYEYLTQHTEIGACGTFIERFGPGGIFRTASPFVKAAEIRALLLFTPAIPNATVMLRISEIRKHEIQYDPKLPVAEDYDFILQCSRHFPMTILPEYLYRYRAVENSLTHQYDADEDRVFQSTKIVHARALSNLGIKANDRDLRIHRILNSDLIFTSQDEYKEAFSWLLRLKKSNDKLGYYDQEVFQVVLANRFYFISKKATRFGFSTLLFFFKKARKNQWLYFTPIELAKLSIRCLIKYDKF